MARIPRVVHFVLFNLLGAYSLGFHPWESSQCLDLYTQSPNETPVTKLCFDNEDIPLFVNKKSLDIVIESWPTQKRKSAVELIKNLTSYQHSLDRSCLSYGPTPNNNNFFEWRTGYSRFKLNTYPTLSSNPLILDNHVYVILDETNRAIYLSNLKAASSTISKILLIQQQHRSRTNTSVLKSCATLRYHNKRIFQRIYSKECSNESQNCVFTCEGVPINGSHSRNAQLLTTDLPTHIYNKYLVFSFVRDPMTRILSSYAEATPWSSSDFNIEEVKKEATFIGHLEGSTPNVHYRTQSNQLLGSQTQSGDPVKPHFIGKIENFDEDWQRLQVALSPSVIHLTPQERLKLIPSSSSSSTTTTTKNLKEEDKEEKHQDEENGIIHERGSGIHDHIFIPYSKTKHFTIKEELEVCRMYLQDFICFDYDLPQSCLDFLKVVYGPVL